MICNPERHEKLPLGIVLRKTPGVTRWVPFVWTVSAVLPGAAPSQWRELRREGEAVEYHAATVTLNLHRADTEAYLHELRAEVPSVYVVLRDTETDMPPLEVLLATVSPYEAQDYADSGDDLVERLPMPPALRDMVEAFVDAHHVEQPFVKRKRDKARIDLREDGIGDARIAQVADVYRAPAQARKERLQ